MGVYRNSTKMVTFSCFFVLFHFGTGFEWGKMRLFFALFVLSLLGVILRK